MMNMKRKLYGFDGRQPLTDVAMNWTADRRENYLLRKEIHRPVSVDRIVWPTVQPAQTPSGGVFDYWTDLSELQQALKRANYDKNSVLLVALAVCTLDKTAEDFFMPCNPSDIDINWRSLGYDIADNGLISGLSNCGFFKEDGENVRKLRDNLNPKLNNYGLFDCFEEADEFRIWSNKRIPEHFPFLVHQLFEVPNL